MKFSANLMIRVRLFLPLLFMLLCWQPKLLANTPSHNYVITNEIESLEIGKGVLYFEDFSRERTIDQIRKLFTEGEASQFNQDTLNMGYHMGAMWFKFSVESAKEMALETVSDQHLFMSIQYPLLDNVQLFQVLDGQVKKLQVGDGQPFDNRFYHVPDLIFPIKIRTSQRVDYYLRVTSTSSISVPIVIETEQSFVERRYQLDITHGIYFGITLGLCVYNLFLWLGIRKRVYGLYVFAILNLMLFNATLSGHSYRFWPESIFFQQVAIYIFGIISCAAVALFGIAFLKTKKLQPKLHKVIVALIVFCLACIPLLFFVSGEVAAKLNALVLVGGVSILFTASLRGVLMGYRPAAYFLIGQGAVMVSVIFTVLTSQGVIPLFHVADEVMKWSSAFELIFFSIGLADLVNHERRLRAEAQREAAKIQKAMLDAQVKENEKLDQLVRNRTEELEKANQRLEDLNTLDELTGLRNRRYLNQMLPTEHQRAFREKQPISVLMFDIDFFKKLNDTYGHQFGDLCLTSAGEIIRTNLKRPTDIGVRYGGEEFVVVLPATEVSGAAIVAEKIRSEFESTVVRDDQHSVTMTISIGVAGGVPAERDQSEALLKEADDYLYQAKENGRNQVLSSINQ
ncbi:MAG: diguanylate cyclase [Pseudomonadales bacterium]|nr:diguanylate cyclase [Pseudomonadales bacterium]